MEPAKADCVAAQAKQVAAYGGQLASVFHQHALIAERVPAGLEGAINVLDASVATLNQILGLLNDEAKWVREGSCRMLFSNEGLIYVQLLVIETATTLARVEPAFVDACLDRKELKAKIKRDKKASAKNGKPKVDLASLKLDEKAFLEAVENARWSATGETVSECMERLYDLQLHLLLVFQVVTVGGLSKDVSSGAVNVKSIVTFHDRITRTADLVGIKAPGSRSRLENFDSDSGTGSSYYDSDSDATSIKSLRTKKKSTNKRGPPPGARPPLMCGPPPPPSANNFSRPLYAGPPPPPPPANNINKPVFTGPPPPTPPPGAQAQLPAPVIVENVNPPSYSECHKPLVSGPSSVTASTPLGMVPQTPNSSVSSGKTGSFPGSIYPEEKKPIKEAAKVEEVARPIAPEPRLLKSKPGSFGFKLKTLFRSKESLAAEMKRALSDSDSHLLAFVIKRHDLRKVPHSAFHSLEATHMKTILSQLNDNTWYKTFTTLDQFEHGTLDRLIHPYGLREKQEREVVVLKVLQQNRISAWMSLLSEIFRNEPFPMAQGRVLLAIVREKLVDGKPLSALQMLPGPPPPPPPFCQPPPPPPGMRPPANIVSPPFYRSRVSNLSMPAPFPGLPMGPPGPPFAPARAPGPPPGPPLPRNGPPPPPPGGRSNSVRISDTTPLTEPDAKEALTTYNEYTLRPTEAGGSFINPPPPVRSWNRVTITTESAERHLIHQRVLAFNRAGGNVIEAKLRLTEQQSGQVTRLMDELKTGERDTRFEWCWAEISLHGPNGELMDFIGKNGTPVRAMHATFMHLIAKRMPKAHCKPLELYNSLNRPLPAPRPPGPPMPPSQPIIMHRAPSPPRNTKSKGKKYASSIRSYSDSDSDGSSYYDSDSSVGRVKRNLRKHREKKTIRRERKEKNIKKGKYDSDSDSDQSEEEDVIQVKLQLNRGEDVVKALLDIWTPQAEVKGNGKGKKAV